MFSTAVEDLVVRHSAARFADTQGYRLEGDRAHLYAGVMVDASAPAGAAWALQLWACESGGLRGIKVAELAVGGLVSAGVASLEGWTAALPPAGQNAHTMVLALASGGAGLFDRIHDLAVFPVKECFRQPCLQGAVGYRFDEAAVEVSVATVANPRDEDNLSGSLSLELWALPQPYEGGAFEGFLIAGGELGRVAGQASVEDVRLTLPAAPVPAGTWRLVLMLREWTVAGFVTRDFANFSAPHVVAEAPAEGRAPEVEPAPTPAATAAPAAPAAALAAASVPAAAAPPAVAVAASPPAAAKDAIVVPAPAPASIAPTKGIVVPVSTPPAAAAKAATPATAATPLPAKAAVPPAGDKGVSINLATADELAAIKGLGSSVAAAIVAARPYAHLDEVLRAKGMGAKLLKKLRHRLAL